MMNAKLPRRQFLHLAAGAAVLPAASRIAKAQAYPSRPVRWIVPYTPGGSADMVARLIGQFLSERLGQQFIIEPGAAVNVGAETVAKAPPDGHTLLVVAANNTINATLYDRLPFDFIRDIAPVANMVRTPLVMLVGPSFPAKTVVEFITHARANPDKLIMASGGHGALTHMTGELFKAMTGVKMRHAPYRGEPPALHDLMGGQVQVIFAVLPGAIDHIRAGELRALAVTTAARSAALPNVPTLGSAMPGFETAAFFGVGVPKNTPDQVIDKLNKEINAGLADPRINARLADLGSDVAAGSPADFGKLIAGDTEKWAKVIRSANIKPQ
jgi:tripartite-type tricarboxylate transporter receptor subunit TctC